MMKITTKKEVQVKDARITIDFLLENPRLNMELSYTCPKCDGHGCNSHSRNNPECNGGSVTIKLDPLKLDSQIGEPELSKIKKVLSQLPRYASSHDRLRY